jgi:Fanconi anemia group M protein
MSSSSSCVHEVDKQTMKSWIYPTNYPVREYQLDICRKALFSNTLVCLPTGLGKTLIAAVMIYNYYRWFPNGLNFLLTSLQLLFVSSSFSR